MSDVPQEPPKALTAHEIASKAGAQALRGGLAGMAAQTFNVFALMWMRTTMNYQYRHGGTLKGTWAKLYADGGVPRFYRGLVPALFGAPVARFGDVAANEGAMAALGNWEATKDMNPVYKTAVASFSAGCFRVFLMPVDAWKTTKQVEGADGLKRLIEKTKKHPTALWQGSLGAMSATWVGHFPWFATNNWLRENVPTEPFDFTYGKLVRNGMIGFASSCVSDTCSNSLRVLKTTRQTALEPISYKEAATQIIAKDGLLGFFGRGLKTRILTNGMQGAFFTVGWRAIQERLDQRARDQAADAEKEAAEKIEEVQG